MNIIRTIGRKVKCCFAAVVRRFNNMHLNHDYYVISDERSWSGYRIIVEKCRVCGNIRSSLDC